jgi:hypothetical protein
MVPRQRDRIYIEHKKKRKTERKRRTPNYCTKKRPKQKAAGRTQESKKRTHGNLFLKKHCQFLKYAKI